MECLLSQQILINMKKRFKKVKRDPNDDRKRGTLPVGSPEIMKKGGPHANRKRKTGRKRKHKGDFGEES